MISCQIRGSNTNQISSIICSGHAIVAHNRDAQLVCAAITAILTGGANALVTIFRDQVSCKTKLGYARLAQKNANSKQWHELIFLVYVQLLTVKQQYPKCFNWEERFDSAC